MKSTQDGRRNEYSSPPTLEPQIAAYQRKYYLAAFVGVLLCLAITFEFLHLTEREQTKAYLLPIHFTVVALAVLIFRLRVTRSDRRLKNLLILHVGNVPAHFGTILVAANSINDAKVTAEARIFYRYQLLGAAVTGYVVAMAVPLFIYVAPKP